MNAIPVDSYPALCDAIAQLPPPPPGHVRLFRGQTRDYGTLYSSIGRIRAMRPPREAFDTNMRHLHIKGALLIVLGDLLQLSRFTSVDTRISGADFVMAEALVQHYGYQTRYIDVSPSPDVGLWFAANRFMGDASTRIPGDPPRLTFPAWHVPASEPGVLYALDAAPWDGRSTFQDGDFIDLLPLAPEGINRPRRQVGGLLYAPVEDLYRMVRAKFEIRFPWSQCPLDWTTDTVFPGPVQDPIYATLLRAPFFRAFHDGPNGEETVLRRACTLPEYFDVPENEPRRALYRSFDCALEPTLYYPWLRRNLDRLRANPEWRHLRQGFERSVPVMLQRPNMLFSMHRGGPPEPPPAPPPVPPPLRNFFLEYSPESFALAYAEKRMRRGFWCCWLSDSEFVLQSFGAEGGAPWGAEIAVYSWQPGAGLVQTAGPPLMGSYVTVPLELIGMTARGLLRLDPPGNLGHGYFELTTTERFWPELPNRTDLL